VSAPPTAAELAQQKREAEQRERERENEQKKADAKKRADERKKQDEKRLKAGATKLGFNKKKVAEFRKKQEKMENELKAYRESRRRAGRSGTNFGKENLDRSGRKLRKKLTEQRKELLLQRRAFRKAREAEMEGAGGARNNKNTNTNVKKLAVFTARDVNGNTSTNVSKSDSPVAISAKKSNAKKPSAMLQVLQRSSILGRLFGKSGDAWAYRRKMMRYGSFTYFFAKRARHGKNSEKPKSLRPVTKSSVSSNVGESSAAKSANTAAKTSDAGRAKRKDDSNTKVVSVWEWLCQLLWFVAFWWAMPFVYCKKRHDRRAADAEKERRSRLLLSSPAAQQRHKEEKGDKSGDNGFSRFFSKIGGCISACGGSLKKLQGSRNVNTLSLETYRREAVL